jgi:hypothetical protein
MWAAEKGHAEVVQLLVGAGANLRAVDSVCACEIYERLLQHSKGKIEEIL